MQALGKTSRSTSSPLLADSWKGKAEFPSSEPTPNQDGGLAAEPTRGEDASCTARCRFERDARGSRWDVLESGEKKRNACGSLEDTNSRFGGTFLSG